jgi:hypothetical protein
MVNAQSYVDARARADKADEDCAALAAYTHVLNSMLEEAMRSPVGYELVAYLKGRGWGDRLDAAVTALHKGMRR